MMAEDRLNRLSVPAKKFIIDVLVFVDITFRIIAALLESSSMNNVCDTRLTMIIDATSVIAGITTNITLIEKMATNGFANLEYRASTVPSLLCGIRDEGTLPGALSDLCCVIVVDKFAGMGEFASPN
jgi:hypothetical protein